MDDLVYFIIANHNSVNILNECILSINDQIYDNYKILIIDNGSTDGSVELISREFPDIRVISLKENYGYSKANNIGIKEALLENPAFIAFVNTDVVIDKNWLTSLVHFMDDEQYDLAQTIILKYDPENIIDSMGIAVSKNLYIYDVDNGKTFANKGKSKEIFGPCFAAALFRTKALKKLIRDDQLLDEEFVSFYEDVDICFRANYFGLKAGLLYKPLCSHRRSYTAAKNVFNTYFFHGRNYYFIMGTYFPPKLIIKKLPNILANRVISLVKTLKNPKKFYAFVIGSIVGITRMISKGFSSNMHRYYKGTNAKKVQAKIQEGFYE